MQTESILMDFLGEHNDTIHRIIKVTVCANNACEFLSGNIEWGLWGALHAHKVLWLLGITPSILESSEAEVKHSFELQTEIFLAEIQFLLQLSDIALISADHRRHLQLLCSWHSFL